MLGLAGSGVPITRLSLPDEDEVGMVDVDAQPFAGDNSQRSERFFPQPRLHFFVAKHGDPFGIVPIAGDSKGGPPPCQGMRAGVATTSR